MKSPGAWYQNQYNKIEYWEIIVGMQSKIQGFISTWDIYICQYAFFNPAFSLAYFTCAKYYSTINHTSAFMLIFYFQPLFVVSPVHIRFF